jgi:hypothetical protein
VGHVEKWILRSKHLYPKPPFQPPNRIVDLNEDEFEDWLLTNRCAPDDCSQVQEIISYREYLDMYDRMEVVSLSGVFDTMLLVGAQGISNVESRLGTILA